MCRLVLLVMTVLLVAGLGCASTHSDPVEQPCIERPVPRSMPPSSAGPRGLAAANLIFDRKPGPYTADQFSCRSDWPATDAFYIQDQVIFFDERFYDVQGPGANPFGFTYRRFDTHRSGVAIK